MLLPLQFFYMPLLLVLTIIITGCQHVGINESNSLFIERYTDYILGNIPEKYSDLKNPLPNSKENISDGKNLYQTQCVMCHGILGEGNKSILKAHSSCFRVCCTKSRRHEAVWAGDNFKKP